MLKTMTISENHYNERVANNPEAIFYHYKTANEAWDSYNRKDLNSRFNSDELFLYNVEGFGFVVETTGSLRLAGA
jgi:hypothetical protein